MSYDNVVITPPSADPAEKDRSEEEENKRASASTLLVQLARERYEFGVTPDGDPFAVAKVGRDGENRSHVAKMLRGGKNGLRVELSSAFFERYGRTAPQQALADALLVLEGCARAEEPEPVHLRIADHGGATYVDLGDTDETAIRIAQGSWSSVDTAPVLFQRTRLTAALPHPVAGGDLEQLWGTVNVAVEDRPLVLAWLVHALISPDTPHPILSLFAEQGSGKSSATKILVSIVDASPVPLRKPPKDADGWVTAASGSWVVGIDNMSTIPAWLSDSLCRAVTGDGDVRRALYTDGELAVFAFRRCLIVNGIDVGAMHGDYAERSLVATLRRIPPERRRTENALADQWARVYPMVFGALLDLAAGVKGVRPSVRLDSSPRMADFAYTLAAVDAVIGTEGLKRYVGQAQDLAVDSLESEPFIVELQQRIHTEFEGTAGELLAAVTPTDEKWKPPHGWPQDGRRVTSIMARNAPALRHAGWVAEDTGRGGKSKSKRWRLTPPPLKEDLQSGEDENSCPPRPLCPPTQVTGAESGGHSGRHEAGIHPPSPPESQTGGHSGHSGGHRENVCPPDYSPSTSADRHSGHGGHEIPLSLAEGIGTEDSTGPGLFPTPQQPAPRRRQTSGEAVMPASAVCGCGNAMRSAESITRGCCQRCWYRRQRQNRDSDGEPVGDYEEDQTPHGGEWDAA